MSVAYTGVLPSNATSVWCARSTSIHFSRAPRSAGGCGVRDFRSASAHAAARGRLLERDAVDGLRIARELERRTTSSSFGPYVIFPLSFFCTRTRTSDFTSAALPLPSGAPSSRLIHEPWKSATSVWSTMRSYGIAKPSAVRHHRAFAALKSRSSATKKPTHHLANEHAATLEIAELDDARVLHDAAPASRYGLSLSRRRRRPTSSRTAAARATART